ncbi:hypothetical protein EWM64_g9044 [Hericium alpestre]|uniref:Uncharacterized protein n=1 Tax=Hericium alpestre TaxID=135208 RepID=A0A4Y9ZN72_9AGAM|nr:hypothetical protein EWM64_g9044 [Hericium alpestre]
MEDCVYFSLTCRHWNIGRRHIERRIRQYVIEISGSWAGDRLVIVGEGVYWQQLPEGLLTESDKEKLGVDWGSQGACEGQQDLYIASGSESDFIPASNSDSELVRWDVRRQLGLNFVDFTDESFLPTALWDDLRLLDRLLGPNFLQVPKFKPLVLRNLTKHVYVREDAVRQFEVQNGDMLEELRRHFNLGHVVFMRIFPWDDDELRCEWAGDRFDLASLADVTEEVDGQTEGWKDITEEVINEMRDIWLRPDV